MSLISSSNKQSYNLLCYWVINFFIRYIDSINNFVYCQIPNIENSIHDGNSMGDFHNKKWVQIKLFSLDHNWLINILDQLVEKFQEMRYLCMMVLGTFSGFCEHFNLLLFSEIM